MTLFQSCINWMKKFVCVGRILILQLLILINLIDLLLSSYCLQLEGAVDGLLIGQLLIFPNSCHL